MESLQVFLLIVQIIVAIVMIIMILLQKSGGDSLSGIGGNSGGLNSVISSKASANLISNITMVLIAIFMLNCLVLTLISSKIKQNNDLKIDRMIEEQENKVPSNSNNGMPKVKQKTVPQDKPASPALPDV